MKTISDRLNYVSRVIREGRSTSRTFDGCFEEGDGDALVFALVKRADKSGGPLAENLPRYISISSIESARAKPQQARE